MSAVLKRKMFMKPPQPVKKAAGGIMSIVEDDEDVEDNYLDRNPENPEIIANNLRGDMRSMDERYLELAQMVGEQAFETPEEVVVLMQSQLAQQGMPAQQPAVPAPGPQGLAAMSQSVAPAAPPQPGMPAPQAGAPVQPQQPGGIEALVAEPATPEQPVQRAQGSGPMGEVALPLGLTPETPSAPFPEFYDDYTQSSDYTNLMNADLDSQLSSFMAGGGDPEALMATAVQGVEPIPEVSPLPFGSGMAEGELPMDYSGVEEYSTPELGLANMEQPVSPRASRTASGAALAGLGALIPKTKASNMPSLMAMQREGVREFERERRRRAEQERDPNNPLNASIFSNLEPVRRAQGSPPLGERVEPSLRIEDEINQPTKRAARIPAWQRILQAEGVLPERGGSAIPKSRPLTPAELQETLTKKEGQGPFTRRLYDFARSRGIDPNIVEGRVRSLLRTPAAQRLISAGSFLASSHPLARLGQVGLAAGPLVYDMMTREEVQPNQGVVPPLPPLPDGKPSAADFIPPQAGSVFPSIAPSAPETETETPAEQAAPTAVELAEQAVRPVTPAAEEATSQAVVDTDYPSSLDAQNLEAAGQGDPFDLTVPAKPMPGESGKDFAQRVRERAALYKDLLGEDPEARKAQAYWILAEAGLQLMGAKGYSQGERFSKGLAGVPSAFAKLSAQQTDMERKATAAAISAIEAEDANAAKFANDLYKAMITRQEKGSDRRNKIAAQTQVLMSGYGMAPEQAQNIATLMVDGALQPDAMANIRDPFGNVQMYGPSNQPIKEGDIGYIAPNYPFQRTSPDLPTPVIPVDDMRKVQKEVGDDQRMLVLIQDAKGKLQEIVGPANVLTRALTSVTQPILGDIGPLTADRVAASNVANAANRVIAQMTAINPERVSVYEQQANEKLQINVNSLLTSPDIEVGKLLRMEAELINRINENKFRLNPRDSEFRQVSVPPLGTSRDPLPQTAWGQLGSYFEARPNATVHIRVGDRVVSLTKQQYMAGLNQQ